MRAEPSRAADAKQVAKRAASLSLRRCLCLPLTAKWRRRPLKREPFGARHLAAEWLSMPPHKRRIKKSIASPLPARAGDEEAPSLHLGAASTAGRLTRLLWRAPERPGAESSPDCV